MESFLKFVFILILIWLGFSLLMRYVFPRLLIYWVKRKQKKMMEQMGIDPDAFDQKEENKKDGEVSIDKNPKKDKKGSSENMGEYVDFEEID
jgi:phage antirepressor YoqD-like protein